MLNKLLRYELKVTARTLLPVGGGVLAFTVVTSLVNAVLNSKSNLPDMVEFLQALLLFAAGLALLLVVTACVFVNVQRFYKLLGEQGYLNQEMTAAPADVLILPMTGDLSPAITLATRLREAGIRTQLYTENKKFKQKLSYADKLAIPYVIFLGEDEISAGLVSLKDMAGGEQVTVSPEEATERIQSGIALKNQGTPIVDKGHIAP